MHDAGREPIPSLGGVETFRDANAVPNCSGKHQDEISGIMVFLPNFGDEKGVAETIKLSGLKLCLC